MPTGAFASQQPQAGMLVIQTDRHITRLIGQNALFGQPIVQPAAFLQRPAHRRFLGSRRVQTILKGFTHMVIIAQTGAKAGEALLSQGVRRLGFTG